MKLRKVNARYEIGKAHEALIPPCQEAINNSMVKYNETDIIRLALEELWKRATGKKNLPADVMQSHKLYINDNDL